MFSRRALLEISNLLPQVFLYYRLKKRAFKWVIDRRAFFEIKLVRTIRTLIGWASTILSGGSEEAAWAQLIQTGRKTESKIAPGRDRPKWNAFTTTTSDSHFIDFPIFQIICKIVHCVLRFLSFKIKKERKWENC